MTGLRSVGRGALQDQAALISPSRCATRRRASGCIVREIMMSAEPCSQGKTTWSSSSAISCTYPCPWNTIEGPDARSIRQRGGQLYPPRAPSAGPSLSSAGSPRSAVGQSALASRRSSLGYDVPRSSGRPRRTTSARTTASLCSVSRAEKRSVSVPSRARRRSSVRRGR